MDADTWLTLSLFIASFTLLGVWLGSGATPGHLWAIASAAAFCNGFTIPVSEYDLRVEFLVLPMALCIAWMRSQRDPDWKRRDMESRRAFGPGLALWASPWLIMALVTSVAVSIHPGRSLVMFAQLSLAVAALAITLAYPLSADRMFLITHRTFAVLSALSLLQYLFSLEDRLVGPTFEPNILGSMTATWVAVFFLARPTFKGKLGSIDGLGLVVIGTTSLLSTTRAAWLVLALVLVSEAIRRSRRSPTGILIVLTLVALSIVGTMLITGGTWPVESWQWRLQHLASSESGTGQYRLGVWDQAIDDLQSRGPEFLWGTGLNSFSHYHLIDATRTGEAYLSSLWLGMLYDIGFIGLFAGSVFMLRVLLAMGPFRLNTFALAGGLAFAGMFTNLLWFTFPWIYVGMAIRIARQREHRCNTVAAGKFVEREGDIVHRRSLTEE